MTIDTIIDIYGGNTVPSMASFKAAGVQAVIHKATQGSTEVDSEYATHKSDALAQGLLWGAYAFGDGSDPETQAAHFLNVARPGAKTLIALDLEENTANQMTLAQAGQFALAVYKAVGSWPLLYTSYGFVSTAIQYGQKMPPELLNCPLWIACYGCDKPLLPPGWSTWHLWQYVDNRRFPGITNAFDCSKANPDVFADMDAFTSWWGS